MNKITTISIPVMHGKMKRTFMNCEDLESYIILETKFWSSLNEKCKDAEQLALTNRIFTEITRSVLSLLQAIQRAWAKDQTEKIESDVNEFTKLIDSISFPFSDTSIGKLISRTSEGNSMTAAFILYLTCEPSMPMNQLAMNLEVARTDIKGTASHNHRKTREIFEKYESNKLTANRLLSIHENYAANDGEDLINSMKTIIESMKSITEDAATKHTVFKDWVFKETESYANAIVTKEEEWSSDKEKFVDRIESENDAFTKQVHEEYEEAKGVIKETYDAFKAQVEMKESVKYWDDKSKKHAYSKNIWLGLAVIFIILIFSVPYNIPEITHTNGTNTETSKTNPSYTLEYVASVIDPIKIIKSLLYLSLLSYAVRFASKQYSLQQQLSLEALERNIMLKTYIALMLEGKLVDEKDRMVALNTLFRPSGAITTQDFGNLLPIENVMKPPAKK